MKDNPLMISLLIGLIVVLVIAGVSFLVKTNSLSADYKNELAKKIALEKTVENLKDENGSLKKNIEQLNTQIEQLNTQTEDLKKQYATEVEELKEKNLKLNNLKMKLEENLKDELMKRKVDEE